MTADRWDDTPIADAARRAAMISNPARLSLPHPDHVRRVTVANQKGGVGKTTSTVNLAWTLALHGMKVLVVDLDPQGNASTACGAVHQIGTPSSYELLIGKASPAEATQVNEENPNLHCIPATIDLAGAEIELVSMVRREYRLRDNLSDEYLEEAGYDYVFIDCPPSLGLLTINAMNTATEVLIPIQCEYYALEGVGQLLNNISMIRQHLNPELHVSAVLLTMYDARTKLAEQVAEEVQSHFGSVVLDNIIPRSVKVSEAPGYGKTVLQYDAGSRGALAYFDAAVELAERGDYLPIEATAPIGVAPELRVELANQAQEAQS